MVQKMNVFICPPDVLVGVILHSGSDLCMC